MSKIEKFEDIIAWQKAREFNNLLYIATTKKPFASDFDLVRQIRRSSISVLSNIAEGFERRGISEFIQFLNIAKGSAGEVRAQLYIAFDQSYISQTEFDEFQKRITEISKMISGLMSYLLKSKNAGNAFHEPAFDYEVLNLEKELFKFQSSLAIS